MDVMDLLHTARRISRQLDCPWRTSYPRLEERLREELSGIESKSMMTCHARLQLTQDTGSRTHCPLNKTYRITLFKAPPGAEDQDRLLEMYNTKPQKASIASKSKGLLIPPPPSLYVFPNTAQLFSARLSTGRLTIPLVGERRQDVLPTGAHKHTIAVTSTFASKDFEHYSTQCGGAQGTQGVRGQCLLGNLMVYF
jgi:hypothetical protein